MLRRQVRLRREFLYKKEQERQEQQTYERKQLLKRAVDEGTEIPGDMRAEAKKLKKDMHYDESQQTPETHVDSEYARAGVVDPKVVITTSRDPSSRLNQFAKEMKLMFPNSLRINRGNYVLNDVVDTCRQNDATDLIILHEHRGQPDGMVVTHFPYGPTCYFSLHNVVLRHDIKDKGTVSEQYPHLIFDGFGSKLGARVKDILRYLFPVPKEEGKRVMTFANRSDFISYRHHVFYKTGKEVQLAEVGPRFEMRPYEIKQGTVDQTEADTEWVYRPYQRTSKKRDFL